MLGSPPGVSLRVSLPNISEVIIRGLYRRQPTQGGVWVEGAWRSQPRPSDGIQVATCKARMGCVAGLVSPGCSTGHVPNIAKHVVQQASSDDPCTGQQLL